MVSGVDTLCQSVGSYWSWAVAQSHQVFVSQHLAATGINQLLAQCSPVDSLHQLLYRLLGGSLHQQHVVASLQGLDVALRFALHPLHVERIGKEQTLEAQLLAK